MGKAAHPHKDATEGKGIGSIREDHFLLEPYEAVL